MHGTSACSHHPGKGNDIGGALMRETIGLAKAAGALGIVLAGEPDYYPRFGLRRCEEFGITDADGNTYDALQCLPLRGEFASVHGKLIESPDFEKLEDPVKLEEIEKEFPAYRKVKVKEGFMQIFEQHLGVVEEIDGDTFLVRYWEKTIPAKLSEELTEKPVKGSDVQFSWNHHGISTITKVLKNLLEST